MLIVLTDVLHTMGNVIPTIARLLHSNMEILPKHPRNQNYCTFKSDSRSFDISNSCNFNHIHLHRPENSWLRTNKKKMKKIAPKMLFLHTKRQTKSDFFDLDNSFGTVTLRHRCCCGCRCQFSTPAMLMSQQ